MGSSKRPVKDMWIGEKMEATPGGRRRGEPLETNYAPALYVRNKGPLTVIQSFTKPDLRRAINGGPLAMEFHDSVFRDEESIRGLSGAGLCPHGRPSNAA